MAAAAARGEGSSTEQINVQLLSGIIVNSLKTIAPHCDAFVYQLNPIIARTANIAAEITVLSATSAGPG